MKDLKVVWIQNMVAGNQLARNNILDNKIEYELLRQVYEMARGLLRFNGVDREKTLEYADKLDDAIEQVKLFDSGN